jgi:predicted O-linked N-acetylglucosamine transferase (SPINDLY family)
LIHTFDYFGDLKDASDVDIARKIHEDGVDILIDLSGFSPFARPKILSFRPAPIQVNYLGYPSTMGSDLVDYIIADCYLIPHATEDRSGVRAS